MGIPRKGGQCLAVIYSNIVALNTKRFTRYMRRHPSKKTKGAVIKFDQDWGGREPTKV